MSAYRQSALLLHGLNEADQRWILEQLNVDDRSQLRDHLAELRELGIPADRNILTSLGISETGERLDDLQAASASEMQMVLRDEPLWMLKQVLALESWPWKEQFLDTLHETQVAKILQMQLPETGFQVRQAMRVHLHEELKNVRRNSLDFSGNAHEKKSWKQRMLGVIGL